MSAIKIFYVEDEIFLSKIIKESLESRGYEVCLVRDGRFAEAELLNFQPDICVLDVMLPNIDGFEIGQIVKKHFPELPIIYLTAKDQTQDVLQGFEVGANDYIRKPCSIEELNVRIQNLMALTKGKSMLTATTPYQVPLGNFIFYTHKYMMEYLGGDPIKLSHKEVELLKLFAQNINQTLHRQVILDKVWGDDSFFNSRNLDVYITKLRGYFKKDPKIKIITLRGVGYHFLIEE
ncbi:response regulator transcription factor [Aureispira anguillae]|uniref:Response regulator transcription factor n=1 Tax=Aureispira anguillae TaxID=2864201 RepID=A0A915YJJ7_9BACT|nr:response regulator transcription factor [Aureispira anguillae]BDS14273.1 response regulator transcription factor [Aureispira anguillae]